MGSVSNAGADQFNYAESISNQVGNVTPTGASADFDGTQTVLGTPGSPAATAGSYTIQAGDTLQSIAQNVYGDANLWYLLADSNGLSAGAALAPGQSISLPNQVVNIGNTSSTFKPYDPGQATGQVTPRPTPHNGHHGGCGGIGAILAVIIGVAVTVLTAGALSGALALSNLLTTGFADLTTLQLAEVGVVAGVAGNVASQVVELATGAESSFNWAGVGLAAIGGAVSAGLNPALGGLDKALGGVDSFGANVANGAIDNLVTQGIGVATGLQKSFDWAGVATAGVEGGVGAAVGSATGSQFLGSVGALLAGATTRTLLTGENFGQSLIQEAPNTVGAFIGTQLGSAIGSAINDVLNADASAKNDGSAQDLRVGGSGGASSGDIAKLQKALPDALAMIANAATSKRLTADQQSELQNVVDYLNSNPDVVTFANFSGLASAVNAAAGASMTNGVPLITIGAGNSNLFDGGSVDVTQLAAILVHETTHLLDDQSNGWMNGAQTLDELRQTERNAYTAEAVFDNAVGNTEVFQGITLDLNANHINSVAELSVIGDVKIMAANQTAKNKAITADNATTDLVNEILSSLSIPGFTPTPDKPLVPVITYSKPPK